MASKTGSLELSAAEIIECPACRGHGGIPRAESSLDATALHHLIMVYTDRPGLPYSAHIALLLKELQERRSAGETPCSDPGWEMRNGKLTCKGCGKTAEQVLARPTTLGAGDDGSRDETTRKRPEPDDDPASMEGSHRREYDGVPTDGQLLDQLQDAFYKADSGYVEQDVELRKALAVLLVRYNRAATRCGSGLGYQGQFLTETQCTLLEGHAGPHQYASDPRQVKTAADSRRQPIDKPPQ